MKTLSDIKDEVAREHGYDDWRSKIYENGDNMMDMLWEKVCKRYAEQTIDRCSVVMCGTYITALVDQVKNELK